MKLTPIQQAILLDRFAIPDVLVDDTHDHYLLLAASGPTQDERPAGMASLPFGLT